MRIAHLTDLHLRAQQPGTSAIGKRRSHAMTTLVPRALDAMRAQQPDFLAVTGDLLDVPGWLTAPIPGFARDMPEFWTNAAIEDYRQVKAWLDATGIPYMVLPGNHDLPDAMWQVFDPAAHTLETGGICCTRFCDHEHDGHRPRRFHPERDRWEQLLQRTNGPLQVHLQHYVITPALNAGYPHTYEEGEEIARRTNACGHVPLCLSGHYHRGTPVLNHGNTTFATTPAFCEAPHPWRIYDLDPDTGSSAVEDYALGAPARRPVVFLDRDGVINTRPSFRCGPEAMELIPGAAAAIHQLNAAGYATLVITNQSAIGMGYVSDAVVRLVNDTMHRLLAEEADARLDGVYHSSAAGAAAVLPRYLEDGKGKPSPRLLQQATTELNLDAARAWMVGDSVGDIATATAYGARPILVETGNGVNVAATVKEQWPHTPVLPDLRAAVAHILS